MQRFESIKNWRRTDDRLVEIDAALLPVGKKKAKEKRTAARCPDFFLIHQQFFLERGILRGPLAL